MNESSDKALCLNILQICLNVFRRSKNSVFSYKKWGWFISFDFIIVWNIIGKFEKVLSHYLKYVRLSPQVHLWIKFRQLIRFMGQISVYRVLTRKKVSYFMEEFMLAKCFELAREVAGVTVLLSHVVFRPFF